MIDDENINDEENEEIEDTDFDIIFKSTTNKHKIDGTHKLSHDSIYLGKIDKDNETDYESTNHDISFDIEKGTQQESEFNNYDDSYYNLALANDLHEVLLEHTNIDFSSTRRKPNRDTFNEYYELCLKQLKYKYTKSEIFVELSHYFTDNIFNMFKLLNKKNATGIILELKNKGYLRDIGNINFI